MKGKHCDICYKEYPDTKMIKETTYFCLSNAELYDYVGHIKNTKGLCLRTSPEFKRVEDKTSGLTKGEYFGAEV